MAKSNRRRIRTKRSAKRPTPPTPAPSANELLLARRIARLNSFIASLCLIPALGFGHDIFFQDAKIVRDAPWLYAACVAIALCLMYIGLRLNTYKLEILENPVPSAVSVARYRKRGVWNIAVSIFINILGLIPILYVNGYISRLATLLPGKERLGDKLSLGVAFGFGAVVSGVLGNLAYDVLKFVVRKMMERNRRCL